MGGKVIAAEKLPYKRKLKENKVVNASLPTVTTVSKEKILVKRSQASHYTSH
jgi:hypothetical protein